MSTEPDYNFNQPAQASSSTSENGSLHLPFALLLVAIAIIFVQQTVTSFKMKTSLNETKVALEKAIDNQKPALTQSGEVEKKLSSMIEDLLILAKTDDQAKAIVNKYGIQTGANSGAAAAPAESK
ncbi:MAG TPA: hypothetical protein VGM54_12570 [Chthoniobacter sp.]|jgi:hypothetical protein